MKHSNLFIACCLSFMASSMSAKDFYVKVGASGNGDSWEQASGDLSKTLLNATAGSTVHVAAGEYKPTLNFKGENSNPKEFRFKIAGGVNLLGGYPASGNGERDPQTNVTSLNGQIDDGSSVYTIAYVTLGDQMAVVDGFTFKNGNGENGEHYGDFSGGAGAIILKGGSEAEGGSPAGMGLRLANCTFENNTAAWGGALKLQRPDNQQALVVLEVENCTFANNKSDQNGGAIAAWGYNIKLKDSQFINNTAEISGNNGGALAAYESTISAENCIFQKNIAGSNGGALFSEGGQDMTVLNCQFNENAGWEGGAIRYTNADEAEMSIQVKDCTFTKNKDAKSNGNGSGGAINYTAWNSTIEITNCQFDGNTVGNAGGALRINGKFNLDHCDFYNNIAGDHAGGWLDAEVATVSNCTFGKNTSTGNAEGTAFKGQIKDLTVSNCRFFENVGNSILGIGWESRVNMENISIYNNTATALAFQNAFADIRNITISGNRSVNNGAIMNGNWEGYSEINLIGATIIGNESAEGKQSFFKTGGDCSITLNNAIYALNTVGGNPDETDYSTGDFMSFVHLYSIWNDKRFIDADDYYGEDISDTPIQIGTTLSELQEVNAQMVHLLTGDNNPAIQTGNPTLAGTTDQLGKTRPEAPSMGACEPSNESGIEIGTVDGTESLLIYPMPATGDFTVKANIGKANNARILIYTHMGQLVQKDAMQMDNGTAVYKGYLPSGNYIIMVETNQAVRTGKLIVK
ncbi:right-handed parallel beta-helix repeat-containing protein [Oscillospiraceae bacterium N12]|jgi:predicted outer membrane repeat protein|uniref:Right-handed parallel beta-helix repeat-containing protein n=1 Tax=Jilunia laotingensis TaxID=2763675 RepID=A0A926IPD4_9BACT|nr:right-handed parallel beta-helix repeat-containing protein [Jilunia laotingensis]MBC8592636.1 right-handed parallel beta-helix repeat-containing protein [Jilunia laotingensis]